MKFTFYDPDDDEPKKEREVKPRRAVKKERGFTLDWVSQLGWEENPFDLEDFHIAGMDDERAELNLFFVKKNKFGVLKADEGNGKTTLLTWLEKELNNFKGVEAHVVDVEKTPSAERFRSKLADPFRHMFKKGDEISTEDLVGLISKKVGGRYVLLIDNAHSLTANHNETLEALLHLDASIVCATNHKLDHMPGKDELGLNVKKRTKAQFEQILQERIELAGGQGISPFNKKALGELTKSANSTKDFLKRGQEMAINVALHKIKLEADKPTQVEQELADALVEEDELAAEEPKTSKKKTAKKSAKTEKKAAKEDKKTEYDELIEQLAFDEK